MPIYELQKLQLIPLVRGNFDALHVLESHLQVALRDSMQSIIPDILIISEQFGDWEGSHRRIDFLGLDKDANLVVVELKRTQDGGHVELQAIRYAAMVSTMTFDRAVDAFDSYLKNLSDMSTVAATKILSHLGWSEPNEDSFAQDVRIILISQEFSKEVTTSVFWLRDHKIDISCVRLLPYCLNEKIFVDVQQIIPLPEAQDYQVRLREKTQMEKEAKKIEKDRTKFDVTTGADNYLALSKRAAIFQVIRYLISKGVSPENIGQACGKRQNRVWYFVDGEVNSKGFNTLAVEKAETSNQTYDQGRWFAGDGDLFAFENKTYAFSNQWGQDWYDAMNHLRERFASEQIDFKATG